MSGPVSEAEELSLSEDSDLPEVSQLITSTQADLVQAAGKSGSLPAAADDGLPYDGGSPSSEGEEPVQDETLSQLSALEEDELSENRASAAVSTSSPSKLCHSAGKHRTQSVFSAPKPSAVKAEEKSPPLPTSAQQASPSQSKKVKPSTDRQAKAGPNKQKSGSTKTPADQAGDAAKSHSKGSSKKRKRTEEEDPAEASMQAKTKRRSEDRGKAGATSKKTTIASDDASSDVQEIPPCTPKPRPKVRERRCTKSRR